jgi:Cu2+-exporting ATPase
VTAAHALQLPFRDDPDFVGLVAHRVASDRYEVDLDVADMRCANCASRIERALTAIDGIERVRINPAQHRVVLDYDPNRVALSAVFDAVSAAGYTPMYVAREVDDPRAHAERRRQLKGIAVAALAMMQVMMFSLPLYVADVDHMSAYYVQLFRWSALVFTAPVVLYSARPFFENAVASFAGAIGRGSTGLAMDVPVALAIAVGFVASAIATVRGTGDVYFDSITMFVFLLLGARFLEQQARRRLGRFDHWLALLPETARRETNGGVETISLDAIRAGDRIVVPSGSRIAVDGDVVAGATQVDEATLTGESRPVAKTIGARVFAGTLNIAQPITVVATKRPAQTRVADIHRLAQRATLDKPRVAVQADAVARHFVAAVLAIAAATFVFWHFADPVMALPAAIAVLVVSCPCALSLATPMAITVATLALRRRGFVITRAHVLERLARIRRVIFDKTGTLTGATPELVAVEPFDGFDAARAVQIARALEHRSDHPLRAAFAPTDVPTPTAVSVRIERGKGISGEVDGVAYRLGNAEYCHATSAPLHPDLTTFYLATVDAPGVPAVVAEFAVRMALRDDVPATLAALSRLGVDTEICTGDRAEPTRALAEGLGIPYSADATPEAKLAHVRELAERGVDVAMVGDGVNDVPGLAAAAVSIAPADGTDLARAHSDAVLLAPGIGAIVEAIVVARATQRIVRQNLTWAAAYNLVAIPLAVAGALPPWAAAIGMSASSLGVTLNALRLARTDKSAEARTKSAMARAELAEARAVPAEVR